MTSPRQDDVASSLPAAAWEQQALAEVDWETSLVVNEARSRQVAWRVAAASLTVAALESVALFLLTPLHSITPYVVSVDRISGDTNVAVTGASQVAAGELNDKHWISEFVTARQRYVYRLLQHDYDTVRRFSAGSVAATYVAQFEGDNALDTTLRDSSELLPQILSITLNEPGIATVRLQIDRREANGSITSQRYVAALRYEYRVPVQARESELIENPFGFRVTAYRLDQELKGS
jgi:type IV secretion system protein VirB8